jgi:5-formyltetrahydrofolate cyclo-ligase
LNSLAALKAQLRRQLRRQRAAIPRLHRRRAAAQAATELIRSARVRRARCIALYLSARSELDTRPLIERLHRLRKRVLVPRVDPHRPGSMRLVELRPGTRLQRGAFGIAEPRVQAPRGQQPDLLILPLLAFDRSGLRLGSGGGYYDRWCARHPAVRPRIGYAYALQQLDTLPAEPWDLRLDAVCTERGLHFFNTRRDRWPTG